MNYKRKQVIQCNAPLFLFHL